MRDSGHLNNGLIFEAPESVSGLNDKLGVQRKCKFMIGSHNTKLVSRILLYNGIEPTLDDNFTILWATSPESDSKNVASPLQKVNHFPFSKRILGNKAELADIIQGSEYFDDFDRFFPVTYVLPRDRDLLFKVMKENPNRTYISKPPEGSCGHGIKIVTFADFYTIHREAVVSEYVTRPLTIDGFKFDLRVYVLVTSFAPLRAFVYREGLARFATESYAVGKESVYSQLTNASLNKHGKNWGNDFKWKLTDLLLELEHRLNRSQEEIMDKILRTISETLALIQPSMIPKKRTSAMNPFFELYGFDLLLDREFNMWLLEINTNPSMGYEQEADYDVKGPLLANTLSIIGIPDEDGENLPNTAPYVSEMEIDAYDARVIMLEDERNEQAGGGFIRIFPSEDNKDLDDYITVLPYAPGETQNERRKKVLNPKKLGRLFTADQASELLIAYLVKLEREARRENNTRAETRLSSFLIAQGYKLSKTSRSIRANLKHFIAKQREAQHEHDATIPDAIETIIMNSRDDYLFDVFSNSRLNGVNDIKALFV